MTDQPAPAPLEGFIDRLNWHEVHGWAYDPSDPENALWLEIIVDDGEPLAFLANMQRPDLVQSNIGHGRYGFLLRFPAPLDPKVAHTIVVRRRSDGRMVPRSPWTLARSPTAGVEARAELEAIVSAEIEAVQSGEEAGPTLRFLLEQVDQLLQGAADADSGTTALQHFRQRWSDHLPGDRVMPLTPDTRPWALVVDADLPDNAQSVHIVRALQTMGYRVAAVASKDLTTQGAIARSLTAEGVAVLGAPMHFTVEDVLRRQRTLYRVVVLIGPLTAASYALVARQHQPRAKIISLLGDPPQGGAAPVLNLTAVLLSDIVLVETDAAVAHLAMQLPGRKLDVLAPDAAIDSVAETLHAAGIVAPRPLTPRPAPAVSQSFP